MATWPISVTGQSIHFLFGYRVGYSPSAHCVINQINQHSLWCATKMLDRDNKQWRFNTVNKIQCFDNIKYAESIKLQWSLDESRTGNYSVELLLTVWLDDLCVCEGHMSRVVAKLVTVDVFSRQLRRSDVVAAIHAQCQWTWLNCLPPVHRPPAMSSVAGRQQWYRPIWRLPCLRKTRVQALVARQSLCHRVTISHHSTCPVIMYHWWISQTPAVSRILMRYSRWHHGAYLPGNLLPVHVCMSQYVIIRLCILWRTVSFCHLSDCCMCKAWHYWKYILYFNNC